MYTLKRTACCDYVEYYNYDIRLEDIEDINQNFNGNYETNGTSITEQDIVNTYNKKDTDKLLMVFKSKNNSVSLPLNTIIESYFDGLLWDNYVDGETLQYASVEDTIEEDNSADDIAFLNNVKPREGEPAYSDVWSQIYNYIYDKYGDLSYEERSTLVTSFMNYYQQNKK